MSWENEKDYLGDALAVKISIGVLYFLSPISITVDGGCFYLRVSTRTSFKLAHELGNLVRTHRRISWNRPTDDECNRTSERTEKVVLNQLIVFSCVPFECIFHSFLSPENQWFSFFQSACCPIPEVMCCLCFILKFLREKVIEPSGWWRTSTPCPSSCSDITKPDEPLYESRHFLLLLLNLQEIDSCLAHSGTYVLFPLHAPWVTSSRLVTVNTTISC